MIGSEESFAVNLFAGSLAGFAAESILHPFDTISLRLKVQSNQTPKYKTTRMAALLMYKEGNIILIKYILIMDVEGIRGFFGGFGATAISAPITSAIYFGAYEVAKSVVCVGSFEVLKVMYSCCHMQERKTQKGCLRCRNH